MSPKGYSTDAGAVETRPPTFFGSRDGVLPVVFSQNGQPVIFYITDDKGATWTATTPVKSAANKQFVWSFSSVKRGFATDGKRFFTTSDSGHTWVGITPRISLEQVEKLDFISARVGWAVGKGVFLKTVDGGTRWAPVNR